MIRPITALTDRLDLVYRERSYFMGVKARLLAAFNLVIIVFVPVNLVKVLLVQAPEVAIRFGLNLCWVAAALLSLRWVRAGFLERAGNGLVLGMLIPVNLTALFFHNYNQPVGAALQLFVLNFVMVLLALVFASRKIAIGLLVVIIVSHVTIYWRGSQSQPMAGSLEYAADTLLRDGLIALGFVFCFGAILVSMIESAHQRSEEAFKATRAAKENLEQLVSERTRDLEAATALAKEASRAKGDFLANMSHEIRTPLNGIIATSDLLRHRDDLPPEAAEQTRLIADSGELLLKLIGDILDFSKIEAGSLVLDNHTFVLASLVADTTALLASTGGRAGVRFECTIDHGLDGNFEGDSFRLRQVLLNLGSNAIKFTPAGGHVELRVTDGGALGDARLVKFEMRDTGIGMDETTLKRIFERFTQADSSTTRRYGGTGLGLAISSRIVEAMDGTLQVESTPGQGSSFYFTVAFLPVAAIPARADVFQPAKARLGLCVLLVEDNLMNRKILAVQLEQLGCRCEMATDGQEALTLLAHEPLPDVVLMDCHMPGVDGWEATRRLRRWASDPLATSCQRKASGLPVIALTAAALPEERARCLDAGMTDFLAKPARLVNLHEALVAFTPASAAIK